MQEDNELDEQDSGPPGQPTSQSTEPSAQPCSGQSARGVRKSMTVTHSSTSTERRVLRSGEVVTSTVEHTQVFDFYSCEEAIKRLDEFLDHELSPDERGDVMNHLQLCRPCFDRFDFEQVLMGSLRDKMSRITAPINLKDRLKDLLQKKRNNL